MAFIKFFKCKRTPSTSNKAKTPSSLFRNLRHPLMKLGRTLEHPAAKQTSSRVSSRVSSVDMETTRRHGRNYDPNSIELKTLGRQLAAFEEEERIWKEREAHHIKRERHMACQIRITQYNLISLQDLLATSPQRYSLSSKKSHRERARACVDRPVMP
ncbi:hypothetical protein BDF14DRAFT_1761641 [Spinellus fusiger]|nr:hypothetical protein BDF14DRAFT_1871541 [Spinellus fusiger]KAI7871491.1 hypothetical protein BDF14DRAFT_1761641 [Spinellus fusiger]